MEPKDPKWCSPGPHSPWRHHPYWKYRGRRRHSIFFKIFLLFVFAGLALGLVHYFSGDSLPHHQWLGYAAWILGILFVCSLILRRMFGPLRWLMKGVEEVSNGNLDFQFPAWGRGEFRYLAETFNLMARRVKEMVQSKEQLLLDVSHELRSPLTRLKVALEMTPKGKHRDSMARDIADMETMLAEILETEQLKSDHGKLRLSSVDLNVLAQEVTRKYKSQKPGVKLIGKPNSLTVTADEARVRTVFQNVLENALKYSSQQKKPVEISFEKREGGTTVLIQDFGQGIPPEEQEKVFEPFYRVDKSRTKGTGGYGLGLSLCQVIMRAHGGEIALESKPGEGTRVVLEFPKAPPTITEQDGE